MADEQSAQATAPPTDRRSLTTCAGHMHWVVARDASFRTQLHRLSRHIAPTARRHRFRLFRPSRLGESRWKRLPTYRESTTRCLNPHSPDEIMIHHERRSAPRCQENRTNSASSAIFTASSMTALAKTVAATSVRAKNSIQSASTRHHPGNTATTAPTLDHPGNVG